MIPLKSVRQGYRRIVSGRAANETQNCSTTSAWQKPRQEPVIQEWAPEEDWKRRHFCTDLGSSYGHANIAKNTEDKRPRNDSRRGRDIPVEQGGELEHTVHCDGHRACAGHTGGAHGERKPRAVAAAMVPVDAQLKAVQTHIAMKNVKESDGLGRHLKCGCSDRVSPRTLQRRPESNDLVDQCGTATEVQDRDSSVVGSGK